jgi:hypothetical protein
MSENGLHNLLGITHIRKELAATSDRVWQATKMLSRKCAL